MTDIMLKTAPLKSTAEKKTFKSIQKTNSNSVESESKEITEKAIQEVLREKTEKLKTVT